jgi:hypothetical protein
MFNMTNSAAGGNECFVSAGLTGLSGAASTYSTGSTTLQYCVNGIMKTKTQVSGGTTPTTDIVTGAAIKGMVANQACVFVWGLKADGTVVVAQGPIVSYTDTSANSTRCPFPILPDTVTPIAYVVIKAGATTSGTWTFGTSNWNATGIVVDTPVNVSNLPPSDPLTA